MSLRRKENNLRKAQARFDRVSRRTKQFQIDFRREQNSRGRFHTHVHIVRGEKTHHGSRGIIHKFANAKYRIKGDAPSVTRTINAWKPKSKKGKVFKGVAKITNFAVHDVTQTAVDTALATETVGLKVSDTASVKSATSSNRNTPVKRWTIIIVVYFSWGGRQLMLSRAFIIT